MNYLLDAETCAAILRRTDAALLERLGRARVGDVRISAVTLAVLQHGVEASRRTAQEQAAVELLLRHVAVEEFSQEAAKEYGKVRMVLSLCDAEVPEEVALAAGQARQMGWTLVTPYAAALARVHGVEAERWDGPGA